MKLRAIVPLLLALWAAPAVAQGCSMCYTSAAGSSKEGQRAIGRGVMVLLLPPVGFMTIGAGLVIRYSKQRDNAS